MLINTNIPSLNITRMLSSSTSKLSSSIARLSSGLRINSAKDDAAGLQISNRLTSQVRGLNVAVRNANDGISMAQVAEGALQESTNILNRIRDLAIQSANGTNSTTDRQAIQQEVKQLQQELARIGSATTFGDQQLLDGTFGVKQLQVGADANVVIGLQIDSALPSDLGSARIETNSGTLLPVSQSNNSVTTALNDLAFTTAPITVDIEGRTEASFTVNTNDSAGNIAEKLNKLSQFTGVKATVKTTATIEYFSDFDKGDKITFSIASADASGTSSADLAFVSSGDGFKDMRKVTSLINSQSDVTGITAEYRPSGSSNIAATQYQTGEDAILLTSANGENIVVGDFFDDDGSGTGNVAAWGIVARNFDGSMENDPEDTLGNVATNSVAVRGVIQLDSLDSFRIASTSAEFGYTNKTTATDATVDEIDVTTALGAHNAIFVVDGALAEIDSNRAALGALQNRLSSTISNLSNVGENSSAARSRIRDTDFAAETATLTKNQILQQASTSLLAQANQIPQAALSLLGT